MAMPAASTTAAAARDTDGNGVITKEEVLDKDSNGKVSKKEFAVLDSNKDGKTSHHEAADLNHDGLVEGIEKKALDADHDGKVERKEVLNAPVADKNRDGVVTRAELKYELKTVQHMSPPPPPPPSPHRRWPVGSAPPPMPPHPRLPPRTSWPCLGMWNSYEEANEEVALIIMFILPLMYTLQWVARRLRKQPYRTVKVAGEEHERPRRARCVQKLNACPCLCTLQVTDAVDMEGSIGGMMRDTVNELSGRSAAAPLPRERDAELTAAAESSTESSASGTVNGGMPHSPPTAAVPTIPPPPESVLPQR